VVEKTTRTEPGTVSIWLETMVWAVEGGGDHQGSENQRGNELSQGSEKSCFHVGLAMWTVLALRSKSIAHRAMDFGPTGADLTHSGRNARENP
jgi:hypothetical protein